MMTEQETILIVEDSSVNREILSRLLTREGYRVWEADSGQSAMETIARKLPDLIVLDIMMSGMDGYAICEGLKKDERTRAVPVIFISSLDTTKNKLTGFEAGGVDYITKPFQPKEVLVRIATHLKLCRLQHQLEEQNRQLEEERRKTEVLLLNVLPRQVGKELIETGSYLPRSFAQVTVCFLDIVSFTATASTLDPEVIIRELNDIFTGFDLIAEENSCERIKTIGDAFLFVCGIHDGNREHAFNVISAAQEMLVFLKERNGESGHQWQVRVGAHSGEVVGGVVGSHRYLYDIFGDTVNIAARMEKLSSPMRINVSEATHTLLQDRFSFCKRGKIEVKGKGELPMYFVEDKCTS